MNQHNWLERRALRNYKLIIFDKDSTICRNRHNHSGFIHNIDEQELMPDVTAKCAELRHAGIKLAVASNQGGVAFGYLSDDQAFSLTHNAAFQIGAGYFLHCPYHSKGTEERYVRDSWLRKPRPGMLQTLMVQAEVEPIQAMMVGDREEDREAARRASCDFTWAWDFFEREQDIDNE